MLKLRKILLNSSRKVKVTLVAFTDFICISLATYISIVVSDLDLLGLDFIDFIRLMWIPIFTILVFYFLGVYKSVVRYINFSVIYIIIRAIVVAFTFNVILKFILFYISGNTSIIPDIPSSLITNLGWFVGLSTTILLVIGSRLLANYYFTDNALANRVVIYGAGSAGIQLASALKVSKEMRTIAFIDNNPTLQGTYLAGIKILHPKKIERLVQRNKVDEVLIAMPSASKSSLSSLLKEIEGYSVKVRILPGLSDLAQGKVLVSELKEVDILDLLGRVEVEASQDLLDKNIKNKSVLVTGAGGSIGSEIARQVAKLKAKTLILLDSNEYSLYSIKEEIESLDSPVNLYSILASVKDKKRMTDVCTTFAVDTIYHAAAYKHVPLVEENPFEGVSNNIFGTLSCVKAAIESNVETFVLISTDKAVRPTNIMGASKRFSEMILQSFSSEKNNSQITRMTMVRFGNVLGSSGSAIPLFQKQIKEGGPVTVTDPEVIRYFMSIPEAAGLVIQAGAMGEGGDVFVLDMGEPVKIFELAKRLINLSGLDLKDEDNLDGDIEIVFTGLRHGEKLYEELLIGDKVSSTAHKQILRAEEECLSKQELDKYLSLLNDAQKDGDVSLLKEIFKEVITGFEPNNNIVDVLHLQRKD